MSEKFWIQDFETGLDRLRIHFITERGRVVSIIVIQYEAYIDGQWRAIVRFDEAHGFFHRDVMSPTGEQEKTVQPAIDRNLALNEAIAHIKQFWRTYRQMYEDEYYGRK
jgi:hypothetical protein